MNLFLDRLDTLEKEFKKEAAFAARLTENHEMWPQELTSELLKQLPFLSDYEVMVTMDRVEPQRGYAFGWADVSNKTERPEIEHEDAGLAHVRIPLIVSERMVKPFSVYLDGERVLPLTEDRLRETLFNPASFDLSTSEPKDPSLIDPLMPPHRNSLGNAEIKTASINKEALLGVGMEIANKDRWGVNVGFPYGVAGTYRLSDDSGWAPTLGLGITGPHIGANYRAPKTKKTKTKKASLLTAIAGTINEKDRDLFVEKIASDASLQAGFKRSGIAGTLVQAMDAKLASAQERLAVLSENILPSVVTVQKLPGGDFLVKSANNEAFNPADAMGEVVNADQAASAMGQETSQMMQPGQTATAVSDPIEDKPLVVVNEKVADEFGEYLVQDSMGNRLLGWVFPQTLAWDGNFTPQPIALFTNGSAYALQDTIAGQMVGKSTGLPSDAPRGDGVFYYVEGGGAVCTAPLTIGSAMAGVDGMSKFVGTDVFGNQVSVSQVEGIRLPTRISDVEYALPSTWKFMRLNNQTELATDPMAMNKAASWDTSATLFYNGSYNLTGGCGLEKISSDLYQDMDPVSAEFMLGLLGVDGALAKQKVAEARKRGSVKLAGLKTITTLAERYQESIKTAAAILEEFPSNLRKDLIKEAAVLEDESTVDKILALNFVGPENLSIFMEYLPDLEESSEKMAEMLLSCYLGLKEMPEGALERSMKNMEEVILTLKALQHAGV